LAVLGSPSSAPDPRVVIAGRALEVRLLQTPADRHDPLRAAAGADPFVPLLIRTPAERFVHLHTDGVARGFDLVFLSADGKILEQQTLGPRREAGVTSERPAAAVLVLEAGQTARLGSKAGDAVQLPAADGVEAPDTITFAGKDPLRHRLFVETAVTADERGRGLMHRARLSPDDGMIFKYAGEDEHSYWMRHTHVSLDIAFLRADGTIRTIHRRAAPDDERPRYPSGGPVQYALEANAGWFDAHGLREGDRALLPERIRKLKAEP
jgi:uncharacterized membrane protein (UPF0127 family)